MVQEYLFIFSIAGAVAALGFYLARVLVFREGDKIRERLTNQSPSEILALRSTRSSGHGTKATRDLLRRLGSAAAKPFMPEDREKVSALRKKLSMAGIYAPGAIRFMTGMKLIGLLIGTVGGYFLGSSLDNVMLGLSLGGLFGYVGPSFWLNGRIRKQQKAIDHGLPDALDLMCVCIEAGLAIDAAMQRVGVELNLAHPRLSRELDITHMETRVGLSRAEALRNLGARTGNSSLQSFAAMLIQAERFGTSIAGALKIHGESIRQQRQFKAEELAAKASVKLSFPLVLFIFPATFIILAGPTVIQLMRSSLFKG
jgi:tight adherence protein C